MNCVYGILANRIRAISSFQEAEMLKVLNANHIEYFLVLDEPEFTLIRIEGSRDLADQVKMSIEALGSELFSRLTIELWYPENDARARIFGARERAGLPKAEEGWKIIGLDATGKWLLAPKDLFKQQSAFASFMARVAGEDSPSLS